MSLRQRPCIILTQQYHVPASRPADFAPPLDFLEMLGHHRSPWQQDYYITTLQLLSSSWCLARLCGSPKVTPHTPRQRNTLLCMPTSMFLVTLQQKEHVRILTPTRILVTAIAGLHSLCRIESNKGFVFWRAVFVYLSHYTAARFYAFFLQH